MEKPKFSKGDRVLAVAAPPEGGFDLQLSPKFLSEGEIIQKIDCNEGYIVRTGEAELVLLMYGKGIITIKSEAPIKLMLDLKT